MWKLGGVWVNSKGSHDCQDNVSTINGISKKGLPHTKQVGPDM